MGQVEGEETIATPDGRQARDTKALADTVSSFTAIPASLAKTLGPKPSGEKVRVSTAKGFQDPSLAHAMVPLDGKERILPALVSRRVEQLLLGVTTLEVMQLKVNPLTQKLERHSALLYAIS
jgi:aspartyl protease family protein